MLNDAVNDALDDVRNKLIKARRDAFEAKMDVLKSQYEQSMAFEEDWLQSSLREIDELFGPQPTDAAGSQ